MSLAYYFTAFQMLISSKEFYLSPHPHPTTSPPLLQLLTTLHFTAFHTFKRGIPYSFILFSQQGDAFTSLFSVNWVKGKSSTHWKFLNEHWSRERDPGWWACIVATCGFRCDPYWSSRGLSYFPSNVYFMWTFDRFVHRYHLLKKQNEANQNENNFAMLSLFTALKGIDLVSIGNRISRKINPKLICS